MRKIIIFILISIILLNSLIFCEEISFTRDDQIAHLVGITIITVSLITINTSLRYNDPSGVIIGTIIGISGIPALMAGYPIGDGYFFWF